MPPPAQLFHPDADVGAEGASRGRNRPARGCSLSDPRQCDGRKSAAVRPCTFRLDVGRNIILSTPVRTRTFSRWVSLTDRCRPDWCRLRQPRHRPQIRRRRNGQSTCPNRPLSKPAKLSQPQFVGATNPRVRDISSRTYVDLLPVG